MDVAPQVFNEGFLAPLERIAERVGVTRRTLHRYFPGREELLRTCWPEARRVCSQAMASTDESRTQLERMLHAGINCGPKYALFTKLESQPADQQAAQQPDCPSYPTCVCPVSRAHSKVASRRFRKRTAAPVVRNLPFCGTGLLVEVNQTVTAPAST